MKMSNRLKQRLVMALIAILIALGVTVSATFAWYVYQTNAHTTNIHMAVGAGATLQISNEKDGVYSSSTVMDSFPGFLNPVSTSRITGGFQKVYGFTNGRENRPYVLANLFGVSEENIDYYKTSLFVRATGPDRGVYLSDIGFEDKDEENPISSAIRVGLVVHEPGFYGEVTVEDKNRVKEFVFEITEKHNPQAQYNTYNGEEGHVLDCEYTDGTTVLFEDLLNEKNYSIYNKDTGIMTLKENSVELFRVQGNVDDEDSEPGNPVQVDVYIWLEGCDADCTNNLCNTTLKNIALGFACESQ